MPNFPRVEPLGYGLEDPFPSADANQLDIDHTKAPNFDEGSTHDPTAWIEIQGTNGFGLKLNSAKLAGPILVPVSVVITGAGGIEIGTGGTAVPFGGYMTGTPRPIFYRGAAPTWETGGIIGSTATAAELFIDGGAGVAELTVEGANAVVNFNSGDLFIRTPDAHVTSVGVLTIDSGGDLTVASGGNLTAEAGANLIIETNDAHVTSGAVLTIDPSGDLVLSGEFIKSGSDAREAERYAILSTATPQTIDTDEDIYEIPTNLTSNSTYNVSDGNRTGQHLTLFRANNSDGESATIHWTSGPGDKVIAGGIGWWCDMSWDGSNWKVVRGSASFFS